jgi:YD repeat-containing protein
VREYTEVNGNNGYSVTQFYNYTGTDEYFLPHLENGKEYKKEFFDKNNNLVSTKSTVYKYFPCHNFFEAHAWDKYRGPDGFEPGIGCTTLAAMGRYPNRIEIDFYPMLSQKIAVDNETDIIDGVTNKTTYTYDDNYKIVRSISDITSNGSTKTTTYQYPFDFSSTAPYNNMTTANIIDVPVVTEATIGSTKVEGKKVNYQSYSYSESGTTKTMYTPANIETYNINTGQYESEIVYDEYNIPGGQLLQFHKANDINTSYILGYNNTFPVVKALNVSKSSLNTAVASALSATGYSNIENLLTYVGTLSAEARRDVWTSFNNALRSYSNMANSMVYTYTYNPLFGMITSETNERGITTYYEFDAFGRLTTIRDHYRNILKNYEYHYKE